MTEMILKVIPVLVLLSHFGIVFLVVTLLNRNTWGKLAFLWINKYLINLVLVVSLGAVLGSLYYSNVIGFPPCVLCWWQRVLLFPIPLLLVVSKIKRDNNVMQYVVPFAILSAVIALYQSYIYLGGSSILPCTAEGGDCSKIYVMAFGYITIPVMSLTVSVYLYILSWYKKLYV